jgi:MoxR-like ATPase
MSIDKVRDLGRALRERIGRVIIGQEEATHLMMVALISEGHLLFEGPPGTGKTLLARTFAACIKLDFKRVQFTPDLMPGDLIGTNLFNFQTNTFSLTKGPLFTEFLLADEINRTPPKTQAALLEAMQERTITIDGTSHPLSSGFMVVATQNPIEQEGTYPLPEAQLDRFLFKVLIGYPGRDEEVTMVKTHGHQTAMPNLDRLGLTPLCDLRFITWVRQVVAGIRLADETVAYVVDLIRATRNHPALQYGASPRAANMLATAARAAAVLEGRDFVTPDDVKGVTPAVLRHRINLAPELEVEGRTTDDVLTALLARVRVPE